MHGAVPVELFVLVCEALEVAHTELAQIGEVDSEWWPVPDDLQAKLDQRAAAVAVLGRLRKADPARIGRMTAEQWNTHLTAAWNEEREAARGQEYRMPAAPVFPEILEQLDDAHEQVRRRALWDVALADAVREINTKGWAW